MGGLDTGEGSSASYTVTLRVPGVLYERIQCAAEALHRSLEDVLLEAVATALPPLSDLPSEAADDLARLPFLNDAALFEVARGTLPADLHAEMDGLLARKGEAARTHTEQQRWDEIVRAHELLALRRAQAALLLQRRGYDMSDPVVLSRLP